MIDLPNIFPAGTTFVLTVGRNFILYLRGPQSITLQSDDQGIIRAEPAQTTNWKPGQYALSLRRDLGNGDIREIRSGSIEIRPDIVNLPDGTDLRSHNRRTLDAIRAVIERRATQDQQKYKINNRELERTPLSDLLKLRSQYESRVAQENGRGRFREYPVIF